MTLDGRVGQEHMPGPDREWLPWSLEWDHRYWHWPSFSVRFGRYWHFTVRFLGWSGGVGYVEIF